jgi:hypothetical protein
VNIFLGILSSSILSKWPSQLNLCPFIHFTILSPLFNYSSSRFDISSSCHRNFQFWRTNTLYKYVSTLKMHFTCFFSSRTRCSVFVCLAITPRLTDLVAFKRQTVTC